jgi:hypothetical protein
MGGFGFGFGFEEDMHILHGGGGRLNGGSFMICCINVSTFCCLHLRQ